MMTLHGALRFAVALCGALALTSQLSWAGAQTDAPVTLAENATPAAEGAAATAEADGDASTEEINEQKSASKELERDLAAELKPIYDLGDENGKGPKIGIDAWVNKKSLTYAVGDTLSISVKPQKDAYITILNIGSSGSTTVLYPNHFQKDARVKAGSVVRIPGRKEKWQITVGGPAGVDLIKVIASKKPLTLKELQTLAATDEKNPLISIGRSSEETAKDLSAELKPDGGDEKDPAFGVRNLLVRVKK